MIVLEGLLVDLVPYSARFDALEHKWENGPAAFWGDMGDRQFFSKDAIKYIQAERRERRGQSSAPAIHFGIQTKEGEPIGLFVLGWQVSHCRLCMLGALIGEPDYWGGGYGTDALLLATDFAFDWLDYRKLWLFTMSLNTRVVRQMRKLGYRLEACHREATHADGEWYDVLVYGLMRHEWLGRAAMIDRLGLKPANERTSNG